MENRFFQDALTVYSAFTEKRDRVQIPREHLAACRAIARRICWDTAFDGYLNEWEAKPALNGATAVVSLSGGLDSAYLLCKLHDEGEKVAAFHAQGVNKDAAKAELGAAERIANALGVRLTVGKFNAPRQVFPDNPYKNQLIVSMAASAYAGEGAVRYGLGSDWCTPLSEATVGYTITDTIEVNEAFQEAMRSHLEGFELVFIDSEVKKVGRIEYLYRNHRKVYEAVSSCVAPYRFRKSWHDANSEKYGVAIPDGRCGSCFKCCMEYLLLVEADCIKPKKAFEEHCWNILATAKTSHRKDLFALDLPKSERVRNLLAYGS